MKKEVNHAREQARAQLDFILKLLKALENNKEFEGQDAREAIEEHPLEVSVRSDWHNPGTSKEPAEYLILLCTGGPAVRIIGDLDGFQQPETGELQFEDWFTPWERYPTTLEEDRALLAYANCFCYGE